ncbi:MAG: helix-hairpin-helix domain-containing protein [Bacteriovoracaceae bacterium]|nr:helix-hairpin-helix domain-containing protein [Bacteriovoracaceae bacterium]
MSLNADSLSYVVTESGLLAKNVQSVLSLSVEQNCTVPFMARYRKEATGGLDEVQIRTILDKYESWQEREKRRTFILETLTKQEKLTKELETAIKSAETINQLEDIYAPHKTKRKTKAQLAIEAGLGNLANEVFNGTLNSRDFKKSLKSLINVELKFETEAKVEQGIFDIIIEQIANNTELKEHLRKDCWTKGSFSSSKRKKAEEIQDYEKFKDYFEFSQKISDLKNPKNAHRYLAMRRGMTLKVLKIQLDYEEQVALNTIESSFYPGGNHPCSDIMDKCSQKAWSQYIHPSLDLEFKSELKKDADEAAIDVFGINLKNLLLQPYLGPKTVLGIDPGIRTGCKLALVDDTGKFIVDTVIYPFEPRKDVQKSKQVVQALIEQFKISHIAVGNGTNGRETLSFLEEYVDSVKNEKCTATLVNEDGASIYSASDIARKEFPDKDLTVRGAISIARRFQDPLAELVKIDPKSMGVGQYQHDVNQARLKKRLEGIVENCVNFVGVDLNTSSAPLLSHISGIGPTVANNIVKHREKSGQFKNREELLSVGRFSEKVYEQAAGFLRIHGGNQPLDETFIHPERYSDLEKWAKDNNHNLSSLRADKDVIQKLKNDKEFRKKIGEFTHDDIIKSLTAPAQDPRTEFKSTSFRKDTKSIDDLKIGQWYPGIVNNITNFGAFIDIGIKEKGLLHISQMSEKFVENAMEVLKVGESVDVRVLEVDKNRKRISLSRKKEQGQYKETETNNKGMSGKQKSNKKPQEIRNNAFAALKDFKV